MEKTKLKIDLDDAMGLANGEYDDEIYEVISNRIVSKSRWSYRSELIIKTIQDARFWKDHYSQGATESQDEGPYEYSDPEFIEVFPKKVEVIVYE